ncbi:oxidoreductase [Natronoglycomyces albus]|uniref:Oxidoreductase n=1 Tax=Natronoglycomyces albus TaxID=2811108 RepID=A0A895XLY0_9ACTN|nr:oxidoreductase [Natronoglycomyces albus]QSB06354.1 oxidoreductase [Natronoglycomyces albus]
MAWFRRKKKQNNDTLDRASDNDDLKHLLEFVRSRTGVEAFIEPRTTVTETTVMLIAHDGEWTRRRVDGVEGAFKFGNKYEIPVYEVAKVGYPQRKRDYDKRQKILRQRGEI